MLLTSLISLVYSASAVLMVSSSAPVTLRLREIGGQMLFTPCFVPACEHGRSRSAESSFGS
jgi:hypothetical protein